jgi:hypothetical protein
VETRENRRSARLETAVLIRIRVQIEGIVHTEHRPPIVAYYPEQRPPIVAEGGAVRIGRRAQIEGAVRIERGVRIER